MAVELAYRAMKIRQKYPNIKLIAVIEGNLQQDAIRIIEDEYDHVLLNLPLYDVIKVLNSSKGSSM